MHWTVKALLGCALNNPVPTPLRGIKGIGSKMGVAKFIRTSSISGRGISAVYELDPPLQGHKTVWVSAVRDDRVYINETMIFGFNAKTNTVTSWHELWVTHDQDITKCLKDAGYEIKP